MRVDVRIAELLPVSIIGVFVMKKSDKSELLDRMGTLKTTTGKYSFCVRHGLRDKAVELLLARRAAHAIRFHFSPKPLEKDPIKAIEIYVDDGILRIQLHRFFVFMGWKPASRRAKAFVVEILEEMLAVEQTGLEGNLALEKLPSKVVGGKSELTARCKTHALRCRLGHNLMPRYSGPHNAEIENNPEEWLDHGIQLVRETGMSDEAMYELCCEWIRTEADARFPNDILAYTAAAWKLRGRTIDRTGRLRQAFRDGDALIDLWRDMTRGITTAKLDLFERLHKIVGFEFPDGFNFLREEAVRLMSEGKVVVAHYLLGRLDRLGILCQTTAVVTADCLMQEVAQRAIDKAIEEKRHGIAAALMVLYPDDRTPKALHAHKKRTIDMVSLVMDMGSEDRLDLARFIHM